MPDTAARVESFWRPRDFEAQLLVDLLRLSPLTLLYGAQGTGKTALLKMGVLPLLRRRVEDQGAKPGVVIPFPDRRTKDAARRRSAEIGVFFDRWTDNPLAALHASIVDMLPVKSARATEASNLSENLSAWTNEHGLRFFIILDCFEQYLRAPYDRAGIADFEHEFVRMINQPRPAAHFLLAVRDAAEPLLSRFRERIDGFGDAFLRLPDLRRAAVPLVAPRSDSTTSVQTDTGSIRNRDTRLADLPAREGKTMLEPNHSAPGETRFQSDALQPRAMRRNSKWVSFAGSFAGIVAGLAVGFITYIGHQDAPMYQRAANDRSAAAETATAAGRPEIPPTETPAATRDIQGPNEPPAVEATGGPVPDRNPAPGAPRDIQVPPAAVEARGRPSADPNPTRPSKPAPAVARRVPRPDNSKIAAASVPDWKTETLHEIEACHAESFVSRVACVERVRWKRCAPDRWNTIPACAAGAPRVALAD